MDRQIECHLIILLFICSGFDGMEMLIIERDVIFTPNQTIQVPGKMLYFEMTELEFNRNRNSNNNNIDDYIVEQTLHKQWLQPLKHSLYLMLNNKINSNANNSDTIPEERLQRARYQEIKNGRPKNSEFGDVINLANGKLEMDQNGRFQLVEMSENCITYCLEETLDGHNITAFWSVYKVRHRDEKRGYRFEWKFTIRKLRSNLFNGKRSIQQTQSTRSFLMRDQDYPKYFAERSAKSKAGVKMEKRIFNTPYDNAELPFNLDYHTQPKRSGLSGVDNLNTGEYYAKATPPTVRLPSIQNSGSNQLPAEDVNNIHQHYFLNKNEVPILKAATFEKVSRFPSSVHAIRSDSIHNFNSLAFPDQIRPSQMSIIPKIHNQLDGYGDILATTSQAPIQFPESIKFQDDIRPTTYRGHYDDNRESILESEQKRNSDFTQFVNRNQLISFPGRHTNVIPIPQINTTPSSFGYELHTSTVPSIQSIYNKQLVNPFELPFNPSFWFSGQQQQQQQQQQHQHQHQQQLPPPFQNQNFISSYPYNENVFSELDPIYHGPSTLATPPVGRIPLNSHNVNGNNGAQFVSELPLSHINDDISYDRNPPTEIHQTVSPNTDTSFTTPLNALTTLKRGITPNNNNDDDDGSDDDDNNSYPDSINAQLPPPDSGTDVRVPYVDTDRSAFSTQASSKKAEKFVPNNGDDSISVEKLNVKKIAEKTTTTTKKSPSKYKSPRNQNTDSAGKTPWTPKRPRLRETDKYRTNSEVIKPSNKKSNGPTRRKIVLRKKTTTTTNEPETVTFDSNESTTENDSSTTTLVPKFDDEPRTTQSVRKSVSVHFAEKVTVMPKKQSKMLFSKRGDINRKLNRIAQIKKVDKADIKNGTLEQ